ncbi:MAG TPA: Gfo/Idh/MocA family oxidoreductase [Opitutaceae bacterium]
MTKTPIRAGVIGMGGYAGAHHHALLQLEEKSEARLVCTCDPQAKAFAVEQELWKFSRRGVRVFDDYRRMLEACGRELDLLVVPTPIPLHAEMHRAGVELGIPVYLEKPPTLDYLELEEMIARDQGARKATLVGFNFIVEQPRRALKARILKGEFGAVQEAHLIASWSRPRSYFERNAWAGRLLGADGRTVLDSCFGNAMAHFVHNILFWAGPDELASWAQLERVQAELYRAHAIEGADTFFVEARTPEGVTLRFALSHACAGASTHSETVVCELADIRYVTGQCAKIRWRDGRLERVSLPPLDPLVENYLDYGRYLRGESLRPATLLSDSRPFVALNDLAYVSSGEIATLPLEQVAAVRNEQEQQEYLSIKDLAPVQDEFVTRGRWPSARDWPRAHPAAVVTIADLPHFHSTVRALAGR